ncbi:DNA mismatch repair endonuclease MutH [Candidatus Pantoea edessiphila]|uniref:DNA mismatch repair protein MutH n=1 Tax=Candidatus Pantoea edessiphila TaxID=2044610 RepID=A0A2P5SXM0_9GAMM|nr:DNA mismatch repair endonuclease MutH [Candidatus Pantoea edessiphila]MBK4775694.1 DNA mismatch repair endonuclease MutH [Pantoea sp. Edef]PPI87075.1 DNA mismatch repair endonuclease MutH [Candidatus Pantoea edessiphila]
MKYFQNKPKNKITLLSRAQALAGFTLENLANNAGLLIPNDLKINKGWIGRLMEIYLGVNSYNKPEQDFVHLGIELKTIPIDSLGCPIENTFICTTSLIKNISSTWKKSNIRNKLSNILWIPVEGNNNIPLKMRRIGRSFLWNPSIKEDMILRKDWEEIMDMIVFNRINYVNNYRGVFLQLKAKTSSCRSLNRTISKESEIILTLPRSFYLKKDFTKIIVSGYHV